MTTAPMVVGRYHQPRAVCLLVAINECSKLSKSMSPLLEGLAPGGQLVVAGVGDEPISVNPVPLLFGTRSIAGTMTGSSIDAEDTLSFSSRQNIRAMIETVPLAKAAEAYGRMMRNEARFRIVLVTGQ